MTDVFISYKREDGDLVRKIAEGLSQEGLDVFFDGKLETGQDWHLELDRRLTAAHAVVVVWSHASIASKNVRAEAVKGDARQALVPVIIDAALKQENLPAPFNLNQTELLANPNDPTSEKWQAFVRDVKETVRRNKGRTKAPSATALSDGLSLARQEFGQWVGEIVDPLRSIASAPGIGLAEVDAQLEGAKRALAREDLFTIVVVGRFKGGKSTLINALLGPATVEGLHGAPLPTDGLPCTATLTHLRHAGQPYVRPIGRPASPGAEPPQFEDMPFEDFHRHARIQVNGADNAAWFDQFESFEIGWPSTLLENGVVLVDSPGHGEDESRTASAHKVVAKADLAIAVYRSDQLLGTDELEFARHVTRHAGKVFTLINVRGDHKMPPDEALKTYTRQRLQLREDLPLDAQNVFFAHFRDAEAASFNRDGWLGESSGLATVQRRLAKFLVKERYVIHLLKTVRQVIWTAEGLSAALEKLQAATVADQGSLDAVLRECKADVGKIEGKKKAIDAILADAEKRACAKAVHSFKVHLAHIIAEMPQDLESRRLPDIDGMWKKVSAGTLGKNAAVGKATELISAIVRDKLQAWASAPEDSPGLMSDLMPIVEKMSAEIKVEVEDIGRIVSTMHGRIAALDPSLKTQGSIVGTGPMLALGAASLIAFGPLGFVVGGWRGFAGGVAGGIATTIGLIALNIIPGMFVFTALLGVGAAIGGAWGSVTALEKRLKDKAWEASKPQLVALGDSPDVRQKIEAELSKWFEDARKNVAEGCRKLVASEEEALARLHTIGVAREERSKALESIGEARGIVEERLQHARKLEARIAGLLA